jgi:hypothetical protein
LFVPPTPKKLDVLTTPIATSSYRTLVVGNEALIVPVCVAHEYKTNTGIITRKMNFMGCI